MATETQLKRIENDWTRMAGESVKVEEISGTIYGFCSELGALRIAYKYRHGDQEATKAGKSGTMNSWFFRLEADSYMQSN